MTVQAFLNAIYKSKPQPKAFPKGTKKIAKGEVQSLLEQAQSKVEAIKSGKQKPIKIDDFSDKFKNNLEGTDYLKAFSPIEKVECNRKSYNTVEEFLEERDSFVENLRSNLC